MAIGLASDFKIYHDELQAGYFERLGQNIDVFNEMSRGAVILTSQASRGDYKKRAFFKSISGVVTRHVTAATAATATATAVKPTQSDQVDVKLNRKVGPIDVTLDAIRKAGISQEEYSFMLGEYLADEIIKKHVADGLAAGATALLGQAAVLLDISALTVNTLTTDILAQCLAKLGDQASQVACWVMHSKPYWNLVRSQISDKVSGVADVVGYQATPATLGRPALVTDCASLKLDVTVDKYYTLALKPGAIRVTVSEELVTVDQMVTGLESLVKRLQGEYAVSVGVDGFQWDTGNGGANPTDAALITTTNWDLAISAATAGAGGVIKSL